MVLVGPGRQREGLDADHVHAGEGLEVQSVQLVSDLGEPLVAAGLQLGGGMVMGQIPQANSLSMLKASAPPA